MQEAGAMKIGKVLSNRKLVFSLLFLGGMALMAVGLMRGEGTVVLMKAVNVCLECIGIG